MIYDARLGIAGVRWALTKEVAQLLVSELTIERELVEERYAMFVCHRRCRRTGHESKILAYYDPKKRDLAPNCRDQITIIEITGPLSRLILPTVMQAAGTIDAIAGLEPA